MGIIKTMSDVDEPQHQGPAGSWRRRCMGIALLTCMSWASFASVQEGPASEFGPSRTLGPAEKSLFPTLHIAKAVGWPAGAQPHAADGLRVSAFASGFDHPRWLYVLPNGDMLVAESDAPPKPEDSKGLRGRVQQWIIKRAGSGSRPSANRITL